MLTQLVQVPYFENLYVNVRNINEEVEDISWEEGASPQIPSSLL